METNRYHHGHLGRTDDGSSPLPDVTEAEMFVFLAIKIQIGLCIWDKLGNDQTIPHTFLQYHYESGQMRDVSGK
jgi:hypothetical protein